MSLSSLLHPPGPFRSFNYPDVPLIVTLPLADIVIKVSPHTRTGCVYTSAQKERHHKWSNLKPI